MPTKLQSELKQTKPFVTLEEEVMLNLARTTEYMMSSLAELLQPSDLTPTQYNALRILRGAGDTGLTCGEIGERMVTKDSDITRLMDRLERRGLVRRERPETNRRIVLTRITSEGLKVLADLDTPIRVSQRKLIGHLGKDRLKLLRDLLEECRPAC